MTLDLSTVEPRWQDALHSAATADWGWPGTAFSASTRALRCDLGLGPLISARWILIWNQNGNPASGVRLVTFQRDVFMVPFNMQPLVDAHAPTDPLASRLLMLDLTRAFQAVQATGAEQWIGQQLRGQPVVFGSTLELVSEGP